jgi:hypothetical protein
MDLEISLVKDLVKDLPLMDPEISLVKVDLPLMDLEISLVRDLPLMKVSILEQKVNIWELMDIQWMEEVITTSIQPGTTLNTTPVSPKDGATQNRDAQISMVLRRKMSTSGKVELELRDKFSLPSKNSKVSSTSTWPRLQPPRKNPSWLLLSKKPNLRMIKERETW